MTTFYRDVSNWDGGASLAGQPFVCAKSSEGTWFKDGYYQNYKAQAAALGIGFAAYHWLSAGVDPVAQADYAYQVSGGVPMMVDDESQGGLNVAATVAFIRQYRARGGQCNVEYLPKWYWQQSGSPNLQPLMDLGMYLVSSNYSQPYSDNGIGFQPYGGWTPSIWQYSSTPYDQNGYPGTVDQLNHLFGTTAKGNDDMAYLIRSGGGDGGIYLITGATAPSGKVAAFGISTPSIATAYTNAGMVQVQLPNGVTVVAAGYDIAPQPWPTSGGSTGPVTVTGTFQGTTG